MSQAVNDIAAPQKNSGQIHQETISVLRQDFAQAVKDKVMVIISQKLQQFDITLDPPELGNMHVRVNLQGEQAVVNFTVNNAQTKDVLEAHMNKLKEMLSEQGVNLGDTDVNQGNDPQHNNEQSDFAHNATGNNQAHDIAEQITFSSEQFNQAITGIDYYA
jgi:flagellar hook-length control protein FliK